MATEQPDYRGLEVHKERAKLDERQKQLKAHLAKKTADPWVVKAHDVYVHEYKRELIESFLLAGATDDDLFELLRIPPELSAMYRHLFFDVAVFETDLDMNEYAQTYSKSKYGAELKQFATTLGLPCLKARMTAGRYCVSGQEAREQLRSTAFVLAQMAKMNDPRAQVSKEALKWAAFCLRASDEDSTTQSLEDSLRVLLSSEGPVDNLDQESEIKEKDLVK